MADSLRWSSSITWWVIVNYLVIGRILARTSPLVIAAVCSAFALGIFIFTSLYVSNYPII
jgi:hypothetical protein